MNMRQILFKKKLNHSTGLTIKLFQNRKYDYSRDQLEKNRDLILKIGGLGIRVVRDFRTSFSFSI